MSKALAKSSRMSSSSVLLTIAVIQSWTVSMSWDSQDTFRLPVTVQVLRTAGNVRESLVVCEFHELLSCVLWTICLQDAMPREGRLEMVNDI